MEKLVPAVSEVQVNAAVPDVLVCAESGVGVICEE